MIVSITDISDIEELTNVEIESKKLSIPQIVEDFELDYSARLFRWQTYFAGKSPQTSKPERVVLKVIIDDKIAGYIAGHLTTRYEIDAEIQSFYILKEHQRKGIGKLLLTELVNWLLAINAHSLCVGIAPGNPYKAFYLKYGGQYLNEHWIWWDDINELADKLTTP